MRSPVPEMSMSWKFCGSSGPVGMNRSIDHLFIVFSNFNSANTIQKQFNLDKAELAIDQLENGFQYQDEPAWLRNVYLAELHNAISTLKSSLNAGK